MKSNMKDGVYINKFNDTSNLIIIENGEFEDGDAVDIFDYSIEMTMQKMDIIMSFRDLEYLGEL